MMVVAWVVGIAATIFWVWMLVDVLTSARPTDQKILWALVIIFLNVIGALIYFFVKRSDQGRLAHHH